MTFAFQACGEYICALSIDPPCNVLKTDTETLPNYGIPEAQELATGWMSPTVGVPTVRAAEIPTVDLHVLRDGATTLLACWCEAQRHSCPRPPSARTESATII